MRIAAIGRDLRNEHLQALETLASGLGAAWHACIRDPERGLRSGQHEPGHAAYLVQVLDATSGPAVLMTQQLDVQPDWLREEFCRGLASIDAAECDRCVGKVHIVDMLTELLLQWPAAPRNEVVAKLVGEIRQTVIEGNKPKALGFLDALDACGELSTHRLNIEADLGRQLAERLCVAAVEAPNNRSYHPARSVHDKIIKLIDLGIGPDHAAFPRAYCDEYLQKAEQATSEEQRFALGRYVAVLERLQAGGLSLEQPGTRQFTLALRDGLVAKRELLASGIAELDRLLRDRRTADGQPDRQAIEAASGRLDEPGAGRAGKSP